MTELVAKPIIKNQFWIVTDGKRKVGNIEANNAGYGVQVNGTFLQFNNKEEIKKQVHIKFQQLDTTNVKSTVPYPEYPTTSRVYNSVCDVTRGIHLYTKTKKSKCLYAAGYFVMEMNGVKSVHFCPKYIFVIRYPYQGPYKTSEEANRQINN
jgi:hypothetical protein